MRVSACARLQARIPLRHRFPVVVTPEKLILLSRNHVQAPRTVQPNQDLCFLNTLNAQTLDTHQYLNAQVLNTNQRCLSLCDSPFLVVSRA